MNLDRIHRLIDLAQSDSPPFPPTEVFCEGWMLRLILDWFSSHGPAGHSLTLLPGATWFSEALLPSPFSYRFRGDPRAEGRTHADAILGHIVVGNWGKADIAIKGNATQLVVTEAKMFSPLSAGTKNAPTFNQAARNVACMAEVLHRARREPGSLRTLAFLVLAPESHISSSGIPSLLAKDSIETAVRIRAAAFAPDLDNWFHDWFLPTVRSAQVAAIPWEQLLADIDKTDPPASSAFRDFYALCITHNSRGEYEAPA